MQQHNPPLPRTCCAKCFKTQVDNKQEKCIHCGRALNRMPVHTQTQQASTPPRVGAR